MTIVATDGPTDVASVVVAIPQKRHRNFRIEDEAWLKLSRIAELRNERTSEVMRDLARGYIAKHRKLIEDDPILKARLRELQERRADSG